MSGSADGFVLLGIPDMNGSIRGKALRPAAFDAAVERVRAVGATVVTDVHVNPNAQHREIWLQDLDGYLVVLADADG